MKTLARFTCLSALILAVAACNSTETSAIEIELTDEAREVPRDPEFRTKLELALAEAHEKWKDDAEESPREEYIANYIAEAQRIVGLSERDFLLKLLGLTTGTEQDIEYLVPIGAVVERMDSEELIKTFGPYAGHPTYASEWSKSIFPWNYNKQGIRTPQQIADLIRSYGPKLPRGLLKSAVPSYAPKHVAETHALIFENDSGERTRLLALVENVESNLDWNAVEVTNQDAEKLSPILKPLVESDRWWVRYYAGQALQRHWNLRYAELVDPLAADPESMVRELMQFENDFHKYRRGDSTRGRTEADRIRLMNEALEAGALPGMENHRGGRPGAGVSGRPNPGRPEPQPQRPNR